MIATSLFLPAGWFSAALTWENASLGRFSSSETAEASNVLDAQSAFRRFMALQARERPVIRHGRNSYEVVDMESLEGDGELRFLYYAKSRPNGGLARPWAVFMQVGALDAEPVLLSPSMLHDLFLVSYTDEAILIRPDEIRRAKVLGRGPIERFAREGGDILRQTVTLQNGHRLAFVWKNEGGTDWIARTPEGDREVWQVPQDLLEKVVLEVPLRVLTQVDEIRIRTRYRPLSGQSFLRNGRRIVNLYPNDVRDTTALHHRVVAHPELRDLTPWKARLHRLRYTVFHEILGHPLVNNRFLRREIFKIMASGERPPTPYAPTSPDEWLAEGAAERWILVAYHNRSLAEWDEEHPYLSGLMLNLLGCLEGTTEPADENIRRWSQNQRRPVLLKKSVRTSG